jgi:hypothetical protein
MTIPLTRPSSRPASPSQQITTRGRWNLAESRNEPESTSVNHKSNVTYAICSSRELAHRRRTRGAPLAHQDVLVATTTRLINPTVPPRGTPGKKPHVPINPEHAEESRNEPGPFRTNQIRKTTFAIRTRLNSAHCRRTRRTGRTPTPPRIFGAGSVRPPSDPS